MVIGRPRICCSERDQSYKGQNTLKLLSYVDLPRIVNIGNVKVTVTYLANVFFFFFAENCQLELCDKITQTEQFFEGLLIFTQGVYTLSQYFVRQGLDTTLQIHILDKVLTLPCRFIY